MSANVVYYSTLAISAVKERQLVDALNMIDCIARRLTGEDAELIRSVRRCVKTKAERHLRVAVQLLDQLRDRHDVEHDADQPDYLKEMFRLWRDIGKKV